MPTQKKISVLLAAGMLLIGGCRSAPPRQQSYAERVQYQRNLSPLAKSLIRTARSYLPEEETRRSTPKDCSDFVGKVFAENGIRLPRTSVEMSLLGKRVASSRNLRAGDLVFFSGERVSRIVGHVGIYVGNGIFIHLARLEVGVAMESLYSDYYRRRYLTARRVIR